MLQQLQTLLDLNLIHYLLDISKADVSKTEPIVAAHNGTVIASEPTVVQKLASVGLSIDDLKDALGL